MPFALILILIAVASTAFLVHQYRAGSLLVDDGAERLVTTPEPPPPPSNVREFSHSGSHADAA